MTEMMSGLNRVFEWVMRLSVINILWVLFNIPICYLLLSLLLADDLSVAFTIILTIAVLSPFLFFPATTAMFGVVRKWVMGETDVPLVKSYWGFYKENYVRSLCGGIVFTLLWIIWGFDFYYFSQVNVFISSLFLAAGLFLILFTLSFFSNTVHSELTFVTSIKNSFFLSLVYPITNILMLIGVAVILYISLTMFTFLLPFFTGTLIALISFTGYYQKMNKILANKKVNPEEKQAEL
ncbi:YesL family protein [Metabacillus niabensis]|uniref:Membrane protein YesL n=1 Tax=Metabacillus niabensis TaxID=324854 RepID=A0ABT9YV86_9BACI|nr:DUF624 domain-containing protein [Metabacillus niabensis]MDQ0223902.1 putative membrane protein YesL [Metabacillus niabensis]